MIFPDWGSEEDEGVSSGAAAGGGGSSAAAGGGRSGSSAAAGGGGSSAAAGGGSSSSAARVEESGGGLAPTGEESSGGLAPTPASKEPSQDPYCVANIFAREHRLGPRYPVPEKLLELAGGIEQEFPKHRELMKSIRYHVQHDPILDSSEQRLRIAFCSTTLGRQWQTRISLAHQLLCLWPFQDVARLYLVEFIGEGQDSLQSWLEEHCYEAVEAGLLVYGQCASVQHWHASICKNAAHYFAADWANVLVNLDTDLMFSPAVVSEVIHVFHKADIHRPKAPYVDISNEMVPGSCGCIAATTHDFTSIRGYDEEFLPSSVQDVDLKRRLKKHGCREVRVWSPALLGFSIPNREPGSVIGEKKVTCHAQCFLTYYRMQMRGL